MIKMYLGYALTLCIFIALSIVMTISVNMPYETNDMFKEFVIYSVFIAVSTFWYYFLIVYVPKGMSTSLFFKHFRDAKFIEKLKDLVVQIIFPAFLAFIICGFIFYTAGIPTYFFADEKIGISLECKELDEKGRWQGHKTLIEAIDNQTGEEWDILWPSDKLPVCPGAIFVEGRRWGLGTYVTDVR